jgi:hypothetical protein
VLVLAPWSVFWDRNFFFAWFPAALPVVRNTFVRGAVSGVGIMTLLAGLAELAAAFAARRVTEDRRMKTDEPAADERSS